MKVKFIYSTNKVMYRMYKNIIGTVSISGGILYMEGDERDSDFRTSLIETITMEDNTLVLTTLNSEYKFERIKGNFEDLELSSLDDNEEERKLLKAKNYIKTKTFVCQIFGDPLINNAMSVCTVPVEMDMYEVREYILNNRVEDIEGNHVVNIIGAYSQNS